MAEHLSGYANLLNAIETRIDAGPPPFIVAIAGPPASGKSTLAQKLTDDLRGSGLSAAFCPMDGFHKTNAQLDAEGLRSVKGRIDTFDGAAFAEAVARLSARHTFWWPRYSRHTHDPVPEGTGIDGTESVYVIEGNYILMPQEPWTSAATHFDLSIFLDAPDSLLIERMIPRHERSGRSIAEAKNKIADADLPNAAIVRSSRGRADILFQDAVDA